ncbi:hypothetical protein [Prescottella sp. R16]|uniref:hypothetical protein n=1 Tax=Prescottella sp. R16 TaxID=3064529 RepID=UPI00272E71F7|nr:hypothetical protein [Prescottella sp. R16]
MSVVADRPTSEPDPRPDDPRPVSRLLDWLRRSGSDTSIALGALSIVTFWTFGIGIVLGVAAIGVGIVASRSEAAVDDERSSLEALFGILAGTFGVIAGLVFLLIAGPHW